MSMLLYILVALLVVGLALYIINLLPIDPTIKRVMHIVILVAVLIWLLTLVWPFFAGAHHPAFRNY